MDEEEIFTICDACFNSIEKWKSEWKDMEENDIMSCIGSCCFTCWVGSRIPDEHEECASWMWINS